MSMEVFTFSRFLGDISPERQLCHQQHLVAPLGNTRDFCSHTFHELLKTGKEEEEVHCH